MEPLMLSKVKELAAKKNLNYSNEYIEEAFYPFLLYPLPEPVLLDLIRLGADERFRELLQVQDYYEHYQSIKIHSKQYSEKELTDLKRKAISAKRNIVNISSMPMNFKNDPYVLLSGYLPDSVKLLRAEETIASAETIIDGYIEMLDFEINLYRQGIPEKAPIEPEPIESPLTNENLKRKMLNELHPTFLECGLQVKAIDFINSLLVFLTTGKYDGLKIGSYKEDILRKKLNSLFFYSLYEASRRYSEITGSRYTNKSIASYLSKCLKKSPEVDSMTTYINAKTGNNTVMGRPVSTIHEMLKKNTL